MLLWLLIATGCTGGLTLVWLARLVHRFFRPAPSVSVHFSPKGGCTEAVVAEIHKARHEILVLAYSFTSKPIAEALLAAKGRGLHVEVVLDHSNEHEVHSDLGLFLEQGLVPLIDAHHAIAHNKVMVIDGATLVTGSFNFTNQAEHENAENLLVIKGMPALALAYRQNFNEHKAHARAVENKPAPAAASSRSSRHAA
jgi:phosphatidylserine/phosphatidylglycerophosphate/cardiolipin synthase-like enzyme